MKADREAEKIMRDLSEGLIEREDALNDLLALGFTRAAANLLIAAEVGEDDNSLDKYKEFER